MKIEFVFSEYDSLETSKFDPNLIEVDVDELKYGKQSLLTLGASTCLVIAAHNTDTNMGLLGHFSSPTKRKSQTSSSNIYEQALEALPKLGPTPRTSIWLGGASPLRLGELDVSAENRQYAKDKLELYLDRFRLPETLVSVNWTPEMTRINASLACDTGHLVVESVLDNI